MKNLIIKTYLLICAISLFSCEDVVTIAVPKNETKLVVDANITNNPGVQTIKLAFSRAYFDNTEASPATGALVKITDNEGNIYDFIQRNDKDNKPTQYFDWKPKANEILGKVGNTYTLQIALNGENYKAVSELKRVPEIDSVNYAFADYSGRPGGTDSTVKKGYRSEFFARDPIGDGDCYLIKGNYYNKKKNYWKEEGKQIAFDAAFQPGAGTDGLIFILPIRRSITRFLLEEGDSIKTEIYSISRGNFDFRNAGDLEANNAGLFATPPGSLPTNVFNANNGSNKKALGWFSASAYSTKTVVIDPKKAVKNTD